MEFGAKEIMIILGVLVFVAIILDVIKRMRAEKYGSIRMSRKKQPSFDGDDLDEYGSELPSGGARVVGYRTVDGDDVASAESQNQAADFQKSPEPAFEQVAKPAAKPEARAPKADVGQASLALGTDREQQSLVIALHLMAQRGEQFSGALLKNALLDCGMRYGSMKIFHHHANDSGSGPVVFSIANSVNPGTFDLDAMDEFSTPGITFLFAVEDTDQPGESFDLLLSTAQSLAKALDGELKDESRSDLTRQTIEHYRQKITDHIRSKRAGVL